MLTNLTYGTFFHKCYQGLDKTIAFREEGDMKKRFFSHLVIAVLAINTLTFALDIQSTNLISINSQTWRVPFDFATIQEAVNSSSVVDDDIIEVVPRAQPYYENVTVNKRLTIRRWPDSPVGEYPIVDGGNGNGVVFNVTSDGVEISGFIIRNGRYGIFAKSSENTFTNNTVTSNDYGIYIVSSSANNKLRDNKMAGNAWNFGVSEYGTLEHFVQDIDTSNTVDGKPVCYWVNRTGETVPTNSGYVAVVNSTSITIEGLVLKSNYQSVLAAFSSQIVVQSFTCSYILMNLQSGIVFNHVNDSEIRNVTFSSIDEGIVLTDSENNLIESNRFTFRFNEIGINVGDSENNIIANNTFVDNYMSSSIGINLLTSNGNVIVANNMSKCWVAAAIDHSNQTTLFHNNLIDNHSAYGQILVGRSSDNHYNNEYEGNFWSDYVGTDGNDDGTGDTPYDFVDFDDQPLHDYKPLMNPWSAWNAYKRPPYPEEELYQMRLRTYSNSTVALASFDFSRYDKRQVDGWRWVSKGAVSLNVTSGYNGFVNITIPRNWLDGPFTVTIDNAPYISYTISVNTTHTSFYIAYSAGTHIIRITGGEVGNIIGDLNGDDKVSLADLVILAKVYGTGS
jgi:parallel beta-helix repeat protein